MKIFWMTLLTFILFVPNGKPNHHEPEVHAEHGVVEHDEEHNTHENHNDKEDHDGHEDHQEHGEEGPSQVGPDKAVTVWDEDQGFQLSSEAINTMNIETDLYAFGQILPKKALVFFQDEVGVYRLREGWFSLVEGTLKKGRFTPHKKTDLTSSDHVVTQGAGFLRVTELDLAAGEASGHAH